MTEYSIVEDITSRTITIAQDLKRFSLQANRMAPPPVWSLDFELFAARPWVASPNNKEVELDIASMYLA